MRGTFYLLPVLLLLLAAGCAVKHGPTFDPRAHSNSALETTLASTNQINPEWLKPSTTEYRLGPGDKLDIEIVGKDDAPTAVLVGPDGKIYFSLAPGLRVWGLTLSQTRDRLEREVARHVRNPKISVVLREVQSQRVWVMGRLNTPGIYSLETPTTVLEAISRAGGLFTSRFSGTTEELADLHHSFVMRRGQILPVNFHRLIVQGDTSQNIYLEPDDFVYLPSALASEIYVLGAVTTPRAVSFKDQVPLSAAIANCGGLLPGAHSKSVVIIRGSLTEPRYATIDLNAILNGRAPEISLQPRDIIYVPDHPLEPAAKIVEMIVNSFVRTVAANDGVRAGGGDTKVGVGINVGN